MNNDRDLVLIAMFTFITVFTWILIDLLQAVKTSTVEASLRQQLTPIEIKIDRTVFTKLEQRSEYR